MYKIEKKEESSKFLSDNEFFSEYHGKLDLTYFQGAFKKHVVKIDGESITMTYIKEDYSR